MSWYALRMCKTSQWLKLNITWRDGNTVLVATAQEQKCLDGSGFVQQEGDLRGCPPVSFARQESVYFRLDLNKVL